MTGRGIPYVDVLVVGAGIVGLAAATEALERGARVLVVDRDEYAAGASVRNFGHIGTTVQAGLRREYALAARERWLRFGAVGAAAVRECGTLVLARAEDELDVLRELRDERGDEVRLLTRAEVADRFRDGTDVVGGALLPMDLCVDPRTAAAGIATWLEARGVGFRWATQVHHVEAGHVVTNRGEFGAGHVVVAVGHDVDRLFPQVAAAAGVRRCALAMQAVTNPLGRTWDSALLTGHSMLRYPAFATCPSLAAVREQLTRTDPDALATDVNLMVTALPDGRLVLGDTHRLFTTTVAPFTVEAEHRLLDRLGADLLGATSLEVLERWQGVYAWADEPYLAERPSPDVSVLSVTTGVGMTTGFGFVADALGALLDHPSVPQPARS